MPQTRHLKRWIFWLLVPWLVLGGFGAIWGSMRMASTGADAAYSAWSPDGHYLAIVVGTTRGQECGMTKPAASYVVVERRWAIFNTGEYTPFCTVAGPQHLHLEWRDPTTLAIDCNGCSGEYSASDVNWGKLRFIFDPDRP